LVAATNRPSSAEGMGRRGGDVSSRPRFRPPRARQLLRLLELLGAHLGRHCLGIYLRGYVLRLPQSPGACLRQRARRRIVCGVGPSLRRGGAELHSPPYANPCADIIRPQWGYLALHTQLRCALALQRASTPANVDAAVSARRVSARALLELWDGCRGSAEEGRAVAAALHVAGRALRTFHRWDGRRRGWHHHDEHCEGDDEAGHDLPNVARFTR
jgi:hypothetical protein